MAAGALLACAVQQPLPDALPDRSRPVEANGICLLDLDGPGRSGRKDTPKQMLGNFGQPLRPIGGARRHRAGVGNRVAKDRFPIFRGHRIARTRIRRPTGLPADGSSKLLHLLRGRTLSASSQMLGTQTGPESRFVDFREGHNTKKRKKRRNSASLTHLVSMVSMTNQYGRHANGK